MNFKRLRNLERNLNEAVRAFAFHGRFMFAFLVVGLAALSIGVWWSVKTAIDTDMRSRLNSEAARIESTLRNRLEAYGNTLVHVRGRFIVDGISTQADFERFMATLEIPRRFPGLKSVGFLDLQPVLHADNSVTYQAPLRLIDPESWSDRKGNTYDALGDPARRAALLTALRTGQLTMSDQLTLVADQGTQGGQAPQGFLIYLPLYKESPPLEQTGDEAQFARSQGILFAAIRNNALFEAAFGSPSLSKEDVNFAVQMKRGQQTPVTIYDRFDVGDKREATPALADPFKVTRTTQMFGQTIVLTVAPLEQFYSISDRFLPMGVGFGAAFISILVLLVLKSSQIQLLYETRAKELSVLAMRESSSQTERLKRLNESAKALSAELDLDSLVTKFFELVTVLSHSRSSFLYFAATAPAKTGITDEDLFKLRGLAGLASLPPTLTRKEIRTLLPRRLIRKRDLLYTGNLVPSIEKFSDWLLIELNSRSLDSCGVLFVSREDGSHFEEMETELIDSMVAQAAGALDNAQLFRQVEDSNRAKSAFLANMSHEIRTPLNAIVGFSEMILSDDMTPSHRSVLARNVRKGSQELTRIVDDILDLSKVEAGKLLIERKHIAIRTLLGEIHSVVDLRLGEKPITFSIEGRGRLPEEIHTDEIRLKQILMNLIGNALKFTERGSVVLRLEHIPVASEEQLLSFSVIDTGLGIARETQSRLFEPFSQGDDSKTRRFGGSGLGLALSRRLSQQLGGDLSLLSSVPDQGSHFEARVQVGALDDVEWTDGHSLKIRSVLHTEDEIKTPARTRPTSLQGAKLLLVEDSVDNQEIFRYFLESAGATVEVADDGLKAVRAAAASDYDLILMDIQIPEIDGKEATRRIRGLGFSRPIVALTAHAMADERESCLRAGCIGQITKPVSGTEFIFEIERYLRSPDGQPSQNFS